MVDKKILGNLIGRSIPTHFSVQQIDKSGRYWVELSLSDIKGLPGVKAWCQANADQFVQYAEARKTADPNTKGILQPESVSLPKRVIKDILGYVPSLGKPVRPSLDGKRPYLITVELPLEFNSPAKTGTSVAKVS